MLKCCKYEVTTCANGKDAINILRDRHSHCDLVLSDVYMPDMDGFKLLETIGLELDLPVIMMSSNGETGVVLRGVTHGAVDFLIKPVRVEELRNVWQHVVRKRKGDTIRENSRESDDDGDERRQDRKRKDRRDSDEATAKKPRVVWTVEMHQQFVNAVNQLGIDKAVPKRILDLLNVEGLTRENVASHLQKYRLYLKRLSGVNAGGKGKGRMSGMDSNFAMLHAHAALPLGVPGNFPNMPGAMPGMGISLGYDTNNPHLALQMQQMGIHPAHMGLTLSPSGTGLEASPSGTPQLSSQPLQHHLPSAPGLVGMASPGLQQHLQPAAPQYGLPPGPIPGLPAPSQLANHGYNLLNSPPQAQSMHESRPGSALPAEPLDARLRSGHLGMPDQPPAAVHSSFAGSLDGLMASEPMRTGGTADSDSLQLGSDLSLPRIGSWLPSGGATGLPMDSHPHFKPFDGDLPQGSGTHDEHSGVGAPNDWDIFSRDLNQEGNSAAPLSSSLSPHGRSQHDPAMDDLLQMFLKSSDSATNSSR
ncbi:hypothetical protein WJX84_009894 [Apatococcus fuscideae]